MLVVKCALEGLLKTGDLRRYSLRLRKEIDSAIAVKMGGKNRQNLHS